MIKSTLPKFTAEKSLNMVSKYYNLVTNSISHVNKIEIIPQLSQPLPSWWLVRGPCYCFDSHGVFCVREVCSIFGGPCSIEQCKKRLL